jgi:hypothetical protein
MSPRLADDGSRRVETGVICVTAACACVRPPRMRLVSFAVPRDVQAPHCASCAPCTCQFARHCPTTKHTGSCPSRTRTAPVPSPSGTRRWPRILRDSITTSRRGSTPSPGISLKPSRSAAVTRPPACSRATSISVYLSTKQPRRMSRGPPHRYEARRVGKGPGRPPRAPVPANAQPPAADRKPRGSWSRALHGP